jgi:hypothetical protein
MITPKANAKLISLLVSLKRENVETLAIMIAASNILITDITKKGELVIEHLDDQKGESKITK